MIGELVIILTLFIAGLHYTRCAFKGFSYKEKIVAEIYEYPMSNRYQYAGSAYFEYNNINYSASFNHFGLPYIKKRRVIRFNTETPQKIVVNSSVYASLIAGIFFDALAITFLIWRVTILL